jgi:acyl carrier protein
VAQISTPVGDTASRLQAVFRDVFDDDELVIDRTTTSDDIEDWDSLRHVGLVVNVEVAFGIKFTSLEVASLANVGEMLDLIERKQG